MSHAQHLATGKHPRDGISSRPAYPRKRAARACQTCRQRRTKCDNEQPSCTSCVTLDIDCVYQESDKSRFDPASLAILQRLDALEELLLHGPGQGPQHDLSPPGPVAAVPLTTCSPDFRPPAFGFNEASELYCINIETVLAWPVFGRFPGAHQEANLQGLLQNQGQGVEPLPLSSDVFDYNGAKGLLKRFIENIHIYNPVLEIFKIEKFVTETIYNGLEWDAKSCIVLLIYALGTIAAPDESSGVPPTSSEFRQSEAFQRADSYFFAAQKRMGLLLCSSGLIETQVFFLAGVYLMSALRPIEAWKMFVQALACCQGYQPQLRDTNNEEIQLHRSIYWSCFKSELELRLELNMPDTNIWDLRYRTLYPAPPQGLKSQGEMAWYFYLSEIALRRLKNRILHYIYQEDSRHRSVAANSVVVRDFEEQVDRWLASLPTLLKLDCPIDVSSTTDYSTVVALRFILNGHLIDCYEMMYWRSVVEAVHGSLDDTEDSRFFAQKGFQNCVRRINENEPGFLKRHHGTWLMLRSCTRSALVLIAGARSNVTSLLPENWELAVRKVIKLLKYWKDEVKDASHRLFILEEMMRTDTV